MRNDLTIIYYTANTEQPEFEKKIQEQLIESSRGTKIISVSQKPVDLGENICVGLQGANHYNGKRQLLIGLLAAETKYICTAEADFIYPPEYFEFTPQVDDNIYYVENGLHVLWLDKKPAFYLKGRSDGLVVANREYLIGIVAKSLSNKIEWWNGDQTSAPRLKGMVNYSFLINKQRIPFTMKNSAITFKTRNGISYRCPLTSRTAVSKLPYWGSAKEIRERFR